MQTATIPPYKKKEPQGRASSKWYINYALVTLGSVILAFGLVVFIVPFKIVPGGVYGTAIMLSKLTGVPIGMLALGLNIPLLFWGVRVLGAGFGVKTVYSMVLTSVLIDLLKEVWHIGTLTTDPLVGAIFGGVLIGLSVALVIQGDATTGGTDIVAQILSKYTRIAVGKLFLVIDGLVVVSGIVVFRNVDGAPYAIVAIFVVSRTVDYMISGFDNRKAVFVITEKTEEVRLFILQQLNRGGTLLSGKGLYFVQQDKSTILTALTRKELVQLQQFLARIDPQAFVLALNTNEVFGSGFKPLE